jgi:hypothetical protein
VCAHDTRTHCVHGTCTGLQSDEAEHEELLERPPKNTMSIIFKDAGELPMPVVKVCMRCACARVDSASDVAEAACRQRAVYTFRVTNAKTMQLSWQPHVLVI